MSDDPTKRKQGEAAPTASEVVYLTVKHLDPPSPWMLTPATPADCILCRERLGKPPHSINEWSDVRVCALHIEHIARSMSGPRPHPESYAAIEERRRLEQNNTTGWSTKVGWV
jgi:hypothetical protein